MSQEGKRASSPISRVLSWTVIHLGSASPQTSSNLPESSAGHAIGFLFGLAPGGVYHRRGLLPATRCALTAPFHPYRRPKALRRYTFCCTFRRLTPPRRYLAPCPMEPGLSSPGKPAATVWRARARPYSCTSSLARETATVLSYPSAPVRAGIAHFSIARSAPRPFWPPFSQATLPAKPEAHGPHPRSLRHCYPPGPSHHEP